MSLGFFCGTHKEANWWDFSDNVRRVMARKSFRLVSFGRKYGFVFSTIAKRCCKMDLSGVFYRDQFRYFKFFRNNIWWPYKPSRPPMKAKISVSVKCLRRTIGKWSPGWNLSLKKSEVTPHILYDLWDLKSFCENGTDHKSNDLTPRNRPLSSLQRTSNVHKGVNNRNY